MIPGETILTGADEWCTVCDGPAVWHVKSSPAGWYVGTSCGCGPYTRETHYFESLEEAETALSGYYETGMLEGRRV